MGREQAKHGALTLCIPRVFSLRTLQRFRTVSPNSPGRKQQEKNRGQLDTFVLQSSSFVLGQDEALLLRAIGCVLCAANEAWHRNPNPLSPPRALSIESRKQIFDERDSGPVVWAPNSAKARCYGVGITAWTWFEYPLSRPLPSTAVVT